MARPAMTPTYTAVLEDLPPPSPEDPPLDPGLLEVEMDLEGGREDDGDRDCPGGIGDSDAVDEIPEQARRSENAPAADWYPEIDNLYDPAVARYEMYESRVPAL